MLPCTINYGRFLGLKHPGLFGTAARFYEMGYPPGFCHVWEGGGLDTPLFPIQTRTPIPDPPSQSEGVKPPSLALSLSLSFPSMPRKPPLTRREGGLASYPPPILKRGPHLLSNPPSTDPSGGACQGPSPPPSSQGSPPSTSTVTVRPRPHCRGARKAAWRQAFMSGDPPEGWVAGSGFSIQLRSGGSNFF